jgi:hypothetical protein
MDPYKATLESLKSLKLGETPNYTQTAKKYGVDRTGLSRRHRGVQGTRAEKYENDRLLNTIQELQLVQYIQELGKHGLPPTRQMKQNFATEIA